MFAGAALLEPEHGDLRIVIRDVHTFAPEDPRAVDGYVIAPGKVVQEFVPRINRDGWFVEGGGMWESICPLVDYFDLFPGVESRVALQQAERCSR